jgi:hypothetical protein
MSWARAGAFIAGAAVVLAAATSLVSRQPEAPRFHQVKAFLPWYYETALTQPELAWPHLTDSFVARNNKIATLAAYRRYFESFDSIEVTKVAASRQTPGWWSARLDFTRDDGVVLRPPSYVQFEISCPGSTGLPVVDCDTMDLRINATALLDRDYRARS